MPGEQTPILGPKLRFGKNPEVFPVRSKPQALTISYRQRDTGVSEKVGVEFSDILLS